MSESKEKPCYGSVRFAIPLYTYIGSKRFSLNLNQYRNAHFRDLARAKKNIEGLVFLALRDRGLKLEAPIKVTITLWKESKRLRDLSNVCSIADKFVLDAIVKCGIINDDDCETIPFVEYIYAGIDRENPRMDIKLETIESYTSG